MNHVLLRFTFLFALLAVFSCERSSAEKISVTGSSTVAPVLREIGARFEKQNPKMRIDVQMGGSSRGLADARSGLADVGMMSRALTKKETDVVGHVFAQDGIAIIVHKSNPLNEVSKSEVVSIYTGKQSTWDSGAQITVVNKAEGRSTLELFLKYFSMKNQDVDADIVIGDNEQGIQTVSNNPNAIGYVSIGTAEFNISQGVEIKLLKIDGVTASRDSVRDGTFPISRPLILVTKEQPTGNVKTFIEFVTSEQVHDLIEGQYFVPMGP